MRNQKLKDLLRQPGNRFEFETITRKKAAGIKGGEQNTTCNSCCNPTCPPNNCACNTSCGPN